MRWNILRIVALVLAAGPLLAACGEAEPPPITPTVPTGWVLHRDDKEGFGLMLPFGWSKWDLDTMSLNTVLDQVREENPQLASTLSNQLTSTALKGVKFFAYDQDSYDAGSGFVTNLNLLSEDAPIPPTLDSVMDDAAKELKQALGDSLSGEVNRKIITANGRRVGRLQYDFSIKAPGGKTFSISIIQFAAVRGNSVYVLTCTTDDLYNNDLTFDQIGKGLWLFPKF